MDDLVMLELLLFFVVCALVLVAFMLAGVRDELANIDYELSTRNLFELWDRGQREFYTTDFED